MLRRRFKNMQEIVVNMAIKIAVQITRTVL